MPNELLPGMEDEQRNPELSQWFTPPELALRIARFALAPMDRGQDVWRVLEPSAGRGALVNALLEHMWNPYDRVEAIDIDATNATALSRIDRCKAWQADFLTWETGRRFDIAVMNPPFEGGQTERHIMHALKFADRVVCHCPLTTLAGQARRESLWSKVHLHRLAICSTRPRYGAMNAGEERYGGKTDMCTIDVTLRDHRERTDATDIEWWP